MSVKEGWLLAIDDDKTVLVIDTIKSNLSYNTDEINFYQNFSFQRLGSILLLIPLYYTFFYVTNFFILGFFIYYSKFNKHNYINNYSLCNNLDLIKINLYINSFLKKSYLFFLNNYIFYLLFITNSIFFYYRAII